MTNTKPKPNAGLLAAQHILTSRSRARTRHQKPVSIREAAALFNVAKSHVQRHLKALETTGQPFSRPGNNGRPRNLTDSDETAIIAYIQWLQQCGFPADPRHVEEAANLIRARQFPPLPPVGKSWYSRFVERHEELQRRSRIKVVDRQRHGFEAADPAHLEGFFAKLQDIYQDRKLGPSDCWNVDECGMQFALIRERLEVLVVKTTKSIAPEVTGFANRESCTVIAAVNAVGQAIPAEVIFKAWPSENWDLEGADTAMRFAQSDTGFSNKELTMDWIRHFNRESFNRSTRLQATGKTFCEWFGCNEHLRDPDLPYLMWDRPYFERPIDERVFRLLIIDGFSAHVDPDLMSYCVRFDIDILFLPPHSTHLLQPLDVGVFQPLKAAHQKVLRDHLRSGYLHFSRADFVARLQGIIDEGFTAHNIKEGFRKTGIWPLDGGPLVRYIRKKHIHSSTLAPSHPDLLPQDSRFA